MGIMGDGLLDPLREAQDALNDKLDAILAELTSIRMLLGSQAEASNQRRLPA